MLLGLTLIAILYPLLQPTLCVEEVKDHGLDGLRLLGVPHMLKLLSKLIDRIATASVILLCKLVLLLELFLKQLLLLELLPRCIDRRHRVDLHGFTRSAVALLSERPGQRCWWASRATANLFSDRASLQNLLMVIAST